MDKKKKQPLMSSATERAKARAAASKANKDAD